ncbi:MAG: zinc ribbon domain-containing protein [Dehalococcoidia bacterium]
MPIYEYKCTSCNFSFEERQGFDAAPLCVCPKCRNEARRLFKPAPIIFKGKGFYVTDYPSSSASAATARSKSEETTPTESKKETGTKSESKSKAATATSADD